MKNLFFLLLTHLMIIAPAFAGKTCFMIKEGNTFLINEGGDDCYGQYAPCSTFKIPISMMAYNEGILMDETTPTWDYKEEYNEIYPVDREILKQSYNPTAWMKNSCVWFSQLITMKMGLKKFQDYVSNVFSYGNQDVSGDKGKDNGLIASWLSNSLKISPAEQISFLEKLINSQHAVSQRAQAYTRNIMLVDTLDDSLPDGWKLYGKTGSGTMKDEEGNVTDCQQGWFIG